MLSKKITDLPAPLLYLACSNLDAKSLSNLERSNRFFNKKIEPLYQNKLWAGLITQDISSNPICEKKEDYKSYYKRAMKLFEQIQTALANPKTPKSLFNTLFTQIILLNSHQFAPLIIDRIDVKAKAPLSGKTLLHVAAHHGNSFILNLLLRKEAIVDERDHGYVPPSHPRGRSTFLINHGATALIRAAEIGSQECIEILIRHGADINHASGDFGMTPLHSAAQEGHVQCVASLISAGARVDLRCKLGNYLPLTHAILNNHPECAAIIRKRMEALNMLNPEHDKISCTIL